MFNYLLEIVTADASPTTIRMRGAWATSGASTAVNNLQWLPVITALPQMSVQLVQNGEFGNVSVDYGSISWKPDLANWSALNFNNAAARLWTGNDGDPWANYTQVWGGKLGSLEIDDLVATATLVGNENGLNPDLLSATYAGTGAAEGRSTMKGNPKPWTSGTCLNITPVLIDPVYMIYQFHGYGACSDVLQVYENAFAVSSGGPVSTVPTTYADLQALTLSPGQWAKAPAIGCFRLGGAPSGVITADVAGAMDGSTFPTSIAAIVQHLMKVANVSPTLFHTASLNTFTETWCLFQTDQATFGDVVRSAVGQAGGYLLSSSTGLIGAGKYFETPTQTITLNRDRSTLPLVRDATQQATTSPAYQVKIGHDRNWTPLSSDQVSNAIPVVSALATQVETDAQNALSQLTNIASDNILSRGEKSSVIADFTVIQNEKAPIDTQAAALGVSAATYDAAYTALSSYLTGLSPVWNDTTTDTVIVGTTFRQKFNDYYIAKVNLVNALAASSALVATCANKVVLSNFAQKLKGFLPYSASDPSTFAAPIRATSGGPVIDNQNCVVGINSVNPSYAGKRNVAQAHLTAVGGGSYTLAAGNYANIFASYGAFNVLDQATPTMAQAKPYMLPVKLGDNVYARCLGAEHRCTLRMFLVMVDVNGSVTEAPYWASDGTGAFQTPARPLGGANGDPANFNIMGGTYTVTNANSAHAMVLWRMVGTGASDPWVFFTEPMMGTLPLGQTVLPPYSDGPGDPLGDQTSQNVALDTTKVAGTDSATVLANISAANSLASSANSTAAIGAQLAADVADNNKFSATEKKRWVEKIGSLGATVTNLENQGNALGLQTQVNALQTAWNSLIGMLQGYNYTDTSHATTIKATTFRSTVTAFDNALSALAAAAQDYARIQSQHSTANVFLDPRFERVGDTTAWTWFDSHFVV